MGSLCLMFTALVFGAPPDKDAPSVIVVLGAPGTTEYGAEFEQSATEWERAAREASANWTCIGKAGDAGESDRELLKAALAAHTDASPEPLWLVFLGHGTFDGRQAKFNLRGKDVSGQELSAWLEPIERPLAIINTSSASGPFLQQLSAADRVVVTATKSGFEHNYARFGKFLSQAIVDDTADLDKDGQTSLLEAFLTGSKQAQEFYNEQARLATEHALLDDNGDGRGTPADWYRGVRATREAKDGALPDGPHANQWVLVRSPLEREMPTEVRQQRDALEIEIEELRQQKSELAEDAYYARLEKVLLRLARLYQQLDEPATTDSL